MEPDPSSKSALVVGRYALYDAIAAGGMATVHYGRLLGPVGFSRTVAIKRLHTQFARDPEFVSMFLDEARLAARIRHPNVVPTLDVVATDGELFLVMEYVPGESLARLVRTAAGLGTVVPPRIVAAVMGGVLRGLHAAHEATNERGEPLGIVHRDVSPQNVLVGTDGQARVLDFGVAKAAGRLQTTRDGKLKGKLAYMSPEQLRGKAIDRRTDVFAASTVLWEALTGRRLFRGDNEGAIVTMILEGDVGPPSAAIPEGEVDEPTMEAIRAVDDIVMKGLATDLDVRWESARAMAAALERAIPPAGVSEVSEWVEHFAKDVLDSRAQQVADIESNSAVGPISLRGVQQEAAANQSNPSVAPGRDSRSSVSQVGAAVTGTDEAKSGLSTISVASQAQAAATDSGRRRKMVGSIVGGVGLVGGLAVFVALRAMPSGTTASPASPASVPSQVASVVATAVVSSTPPVASAPPASAPTSEASAQAAAPVVASAPPIAKAPQGPAHAPQHSAPPPPPPPVATHPAPAAGSGCNPPFTFDSQGLKHFKPECL